LSLKRNKNIKNGEVVVRDHPKGGEDGGEGVAARPPLS